MVKKQVSMKEEKKLLWKHENCTERKFTFRRKAGFVNFRLRKKLILWISGSKRKPFSTQEFVRNDLSLAFTKLAFYFKKKGKTYFSFKKKKKKKKKQR